MKQPGGSLSLGRLIETASRLKGREAISYHAANAAQRLRRQGYLPQRGKSNSAYNRFVIPSWKKYDDIYWQSLVHHMILALRTFKEIDFCAVRGKLVLHYFDIPGETPRVQDVIRRLVWLIDNEHWSVDFTRSRWMENWRHTVASMSREEVLTAAGILEIAPKLLISQE